MWVSTLSEWRRLLNPSSGEASSSTGRKSTPVAWRRWVLCSTGSRWLWKVRGALLVVARRCRVGWRQVETVGHATFCGLVRRETLSVFCFSYAFIRQDGDTFAPLWPTVAAELPALCGSHGVPRLSAGIALERPHAGYRRLRNRLENLPRRAQGGISDICPRSGT